MGIEQLKLLSFVKTIIGAGCVSGVALFFLSFFVNGFNDVLSITGIAILLISMWLFGITLFFLLADGIVDKRYTYGNNRKKI